MLVEHWISKQIEMCSANLEIIWADIPETTNVGLCIMYNQVVHLNEGFDISQLLSQVSNLGFSILH